MSIDKLKLVPYNDPILHQPCEKFDFKNPQFDIINFSYKMVDAMRENRGLGLAANQVGYPYKIFVLQSSPIYCVINPKILHVSDEMITLEEGCLSYPGLLVKVKRPLWIKVRFNNPNGSAQTLRFEGMTARCFLHEYDHIEFGQTFIGAADFMQKDKAERHWKKILRKK